MGGGLMQLVAYGAQDIYLTGNPQITFFKVVYRRHTNFSMESIEQTLSGNVGFDSRITATISRNGDLVSGLHVEWNPAAILNISGDDTEYACMAGNCLLKTVTCEIGGQQIDKHHRDWMSAWDDLTQVNPSKTTGHIGSNGKHNVVTDSAGYSPATPYQKSSFNIHGGAKAEIPSNVFKAYNPLKFWFCRNPGLALPLIALQYHEVKIIIETASKSDLSAKADAVAGNTATAPTSSTFKLFADYVYLDTDERRRFAQVSHEYLIEQVQQQTFAAGQSTCTLNFNHPVKELIWGCSPFTTAGRPSSSPAIFQRDDSSGGLDPYVEGNRITLKLNGHERFTPRHPTYFSQHQVAQHHSGHGGVVKSDSVHVYSFALKPEEHQPSGTCNFSRIDNAQLVFSGGSAVTKGLHVYAMNYNVLRIMSGMGGLAYSN